MWLNRYNRIEMHPGIALVAIMHLAGVLGMLSPYHDLFIRLTPLNLLVSGALLLFYHKDWNKSFLKAGLIVYIFGFLIEFIGVQTGLIFGEYAYGSALGFKVGGVPLLIGLNWLLLSYCAIAVLQSVKTSNWMKSLLAATLLTGLDVLIEPVAMRFDMWSWESDIVPLSNYLAWFVISFLMAMLLQRHVNQKKNTLAPVLLAVQALFFGILNFV